MLIECRLHTKRTRVLPEDSLAPARIARTAYTVRTQLSIGPKKRKPPTPQPQLTPNGAQYQACEEKRRKKRVKALGARKQEKGQRKGPPPLRRCWQAGTARVKTAAHSFQATKVRNDREMWMRKGRVGGTGRVGTAKRGGCGQRGKSLRPQPEAMMDPAKQSREGLAGSFPYIDRLHMHQRGEARAEWAGGGGSRAARSGMYICTVPMHSKFLNVQIISPARRNPRRDGPCPLLAATEKARRYFARKLVTWELEWAHREENIGREAGGSVSPRTPPRRAQLE